MVDYFKYGNILDEYGTNFTKLANLGEFEECFGREKELLELMEILVRKQKNNPVLVGDAGVGKTSVVELFATRISKNLVPFSLEGKIIISLNISQILAGAKYRGEFEERFQKFLNAILSNSKIILFIDEIHTIMGGSTSDSGQNDGSLNIAQMLKPILARGKLQCIGATTIKEYEIIEKDPALNRRFQQIKVNEPTVDDTIKILYNLRPSLETFHNVEITSEALKLAADLSSRYIYDKYLPDKAIDLIDRAAAKEVINYTRPENNSLVISIINSSLNHISKLKQQAFKENNIPVIYVLNQIEHAYKNVLIYWMENPLEISKQYYDNNPVKNNIVAKELISKMRFSIIKHIDDLLFSNPKLEKYIIRSSNRKNINFNENKKLYINLNNKVLNKYKINPNIYEISVLLLFKWLEINKSYINNSFNLENINKSFIYKSLLSIIKSKNKNFKYTSNIVNNKLLDNKQLLEKTKINILKDFLIKLKPILNKAVIVSLNKSSELNLDNKELNIIYSILGHFSENINLFKYINQAKLKYKNNKLNRRAKITENSIYSLLTEMTGIPLNFLSSNMSENLLKLESTLHARVIGQDEAINAISKAIRRSRIGIQNPNKPIASLLFCGPTGVGKTELTKALTMCMFGTERDLIRFDMSEFMEKHAVSRLIGSPPGYIGYDDGGQLTNAVRRHPYSVVLFDEVEKAHPDVLNILLQILDDGRLTDSQKRLVKFDNTVIILTSNVGSLDIQNMLNLNNSFEPFNNLNDYDTNDYISNIDEYSGSIKHIRSSINENFINSIRSSLNYEFDNSDNIDKISDSKVVIEDNENLKELKKVVFNRLSSKFLPEFLNRLDDIIIFQPLKPVEIIKICDLLISDLIIRISKKNIILTVSDEVKYKLAKEGYNPSFGARPLRRVITKNIEDPITELLLKNINLENNISLIKFELNEKNEIVSNISLNK
jgi:ATP-dependent Clp protease ATP-binding subunit ClpA